MSKSIYERVLNLRNRISLDDDDTIYEEDYLLLDEVLDLIENIGGEDTDIETQIYDYNNTVDVYRELEVGATIKNQEKLLKEHMQLSYDLEYMLVHGIEDDMKYTKTANRLLTVREKLQEILNWKLESELNDNK